MAEDKKPTSQADSPKDEKKPDRLDEFFKKHKWAFPTGIAVLVVAAILAVLAFSGVFSGGGDEEPNPSPSPTATESSAPGDGNNGSGDPGATTAPSATQEPAPEETSAPPSAATTREVQSVADAYVSQVNASSDNAGLASSVDGIAARPLIETLKIASYDSIPKGGKLSGSPSSNEENLWTVDVVNDSGESLYMLTVLAQESDGRVQARVMYMDIRQTVTDDEPNLDADGYPLPAPVFPLSPGQADSIKSTAWGVVKGYGEYNGGDDVAAREARVKASVHDGPYPPMISYTSGGGEQVRLYQPEKFEMLPGIGNDGSKDGVISVNIKVAYGNNAAASPVPIETLNLVVDFKWNNDMQMWQAVELRTA